MTGYQILEGARERLRAAVEYLEAGGQVATLTVVPVPESTSERGPSFLYPVQVELGGEIGDELRRALLAALGKKLGEA